MICVTTAWVGMLQRVGECQVFDSAWRVVTVMLIIQNTLVLCASNQQINVTFTCLSVYAGDTD